jgi:hypothetical protein
VTGARGHLRWNIIGDSKGITAWWESIEASCLCSKSSLRTTECLFTNKNDFCDFRNYLVEHDVFGQDTKKATGLKKGKNEKDLTIHNHIVGTDSLHSVSGPET